MLKPMNKFDGSPWQHAINKAILGELPNLNRRSILLLARSQKSK